MVIKIVFPRREDFALLNQEFSYECKSFSLKHVYRKENADDFKQLQENERLWHLPIGLEHTCSPFHSCKFGCNGGKEDNCDACQTVDVVSLISLDEQPPILLTRCEVFIMNGEGKTIDRYLL